MRMNGNSSCGAETRVRERAPRTGGSCPLRRARLCMSKRASVVSKAVDIWILRAVVEIRPKAVGPRERPRSTRVQRHHPDPERHSGLRGAPEHEHRAARRKFGRQLRAACGRRPGRHGAHRHRWPVRDQQDAGCERLSRLRDARRRAQAMSRSIHILRRQAFKAERTYKPVLALCRQAVGWAYSNGRDQELTETAADTRA